MPYKTMPGLKEGLDLLVTINSVKYHVYQQLKADEHKTNLSMTMPQIDERWNIVYDSLRHFKK